MDYFRVGMPRNASSFVSVVEDGEAMIIAESFAMAEAADSAVRIRRKHYRQG